MSELNEKLSNYPLYNFDLTGQEFMEIVYNNQNFKIPSSKILDLIPTQNLNPRVSVFTGNVSTDPSLISDFVSKELYFMCAGSGTYTNFKREDNTTIIIPNNNTLILFKKEKDVTYWTYSEISLDAMAKDAADMAIAAAEAANATTEASLSATQNSIEKTNLAILATEESIEQTELALSATTDANNAANLANEKAGLVQDKLDEVDLIIIDLDALILASQTATTNAITATDNANDKATLANDAATLANQKAVDAQEAIDDVNIMLGVADGVITAAQQATSDTLAAKVLTEQATSDANIAIGLADAATLAANNAANNADGKATLANDAAIAANTAKESADTATINANNATQNSIEKTALAVTATENANTATSNANNASDLANEVATHPPTIVQVGTINYWAFWDTNTNNYVTSSNRADGAQTAITTQIMLVPDAVNLTLGDIKGGTWTIPSILDGFNIVEVAFSIATPSTSGLPTFTLYNLTDSVDILSTPATIDENEYSTYTATTPLVINQANSLVSTGDRIAFNCDVTGTGTKGMSVIISLIKL